MTAVRAVAQEAESVEREREEMPAANEAALEVAAAEVVAVAAKVVVLVVAAAAAGSAAARPNLQLAQAANRSAF